MANGQMANWGFPLMAPELHPIGYWSLTLAHPWTP